MYAHVKIILMKSPNNGGERLNWTSFVTFAFFVLSMYTHNLVCVCVYYLWIDKLGRLFVGLQALLSFLVSITKYLTAGT